MAAPAPSLETVLGEIAARARQTRDLKSDRVVQTFERQILSGKLAAGTRLPTEGELCDILGVSRSVVRDSLRTLVARGLVDVRQGRGTTVAEPNGNAYSDAMLVLLSRSGLTMGDVVSARATIDVHLVPLAAKNGTAEDWAALEAALDSFAEAVDADDAEAAGRFHAEFHYRVLEAVHEPALALMLRPMADLTIVSGAASVRRTSPEDWEVEAHRPILESLKNSDPAAATKAMAAHYEISTRPETYQEFLVRPFADAYFNDF